MFNNIVLVFAQCFVAILCYTKPETTCKAEDTECITGIGRQIFEAAIRGDDKLPALDPLHQEVIEGILPTVKYTLKDTKGIGFKGMIFNEMKFVPPNTVHLDLTLPVYELTADYEIEGKLINSTIEGKGKLFLNITNFHFSIDSTREIYEKDGMKYLKLTDLKVNSELLGTMYINFANLFNGNKQLADPIHKFMNENPKIVANLWKDPLAFGNMKKVFENGNEILAKIPFRDMIKTN